MSRTLPVLFGSLVTAGFLLVSTGAAVNSGGAPSGRTGAPGALTCADSGCHASFGLNADGGSLTLEAPSSWQPGIPVDVRLTVERAGAARFGFSVTVQDANQNMVGAWELIPGQDTAFSEFGADPTHVTHAPAVNTNDTHTWQLRWIPPAQDVGPVTFYAAGNAANGAQGSAGDYIYTSSLSLPSGAGVHAESWQVLPFNVTSVYPLPASERVNLALEMDRTAPVTLHLYDATGRSRVLEERVAPAGTTMLSIDTGSLSPGTYLWRVVVDGHSRTGLLPVTR